MQIMALNSNPILKYSNVQYRVLEEKVKLIKYYKITETAVLLRNWINCPKKYRRGLLKA